MLKPTRKQIKTWLSMVAEFGCVATGATQVQIHHCQGRKCRKDKYQIGELFILPLWIPLHDVGSNHPHNVTHHRKAFVEAFGMERDLFKWMVDKMVDKGLEIPFEQVFLDKIQLVDR